MHLYIFMLFQHTSLYWQLQILLFTVTDENLQTLLTTYALNLTKTGHTLLLVFYLRAYSYRHKLLTVNPNALDIKNYLCHLQI